MDLFSGVKKGSHENNTPLCSLLRWCWVGGRVLEMAPTPPIPVGYPGGFMGVYSRMVLPKKKKKFKEPLRIYI